MKILTRRFLANIVDCFIVGSCAAFFQQIIFPECCPPIVFYIVVFAPYLLRDIVWGNASVGKKFFGLCVLDDEWKKPSAKKVVMRTVVMTIFGSVLMCKSYFSTGGILNILDFEREHLSATVVHKRTFEKLKGQLSENNPNFASEMAKRYSEAIGKTGNSSSS